MDQNAIVIEHIQLAFGKNEYPGDQYLQGSFDGEEPFTAVNPFKGKEQWQALTPDFLDLHADALSFFSEAALRFFLPAYLIADLNDTLLAADPLFVLTHGFYDLSITHQTLAGDFIRRAGKDAFINPRRYGALTFFDYARYRLSVFNRQEADAIVAYFTFKKEMDVHQLDVAGIEAALNLFWLERAQQAPTATALQRHLANEQAYLDAINTTPPESPDTMSR